MSLEYVGDGGILLNVQPGAFGPDFNNDFDTVSPVSAIAYPVISITGSGGITLQGSAIAYPVISITGSGGITLQGTAEAGFTPNTEPTPEPIPPRPQPDYRWDLGSGPFVAMPGPGFSRRRANVPLTLKITVGNDTYYQTRQAKPDFAVWISEIKQIARKEKPKKVRLREWEIMSVMKNLSLKEIIRWKT